MAQKVIIDLQANTDQAAKEIKSLKEQIKKMNQDAVKQTEKFNKELEDVKKNAKSAGQSFFSLKNILKGALGLVAVNKAFEFFREVVMQNQTVVNAFNTATEFLSILFNDIVGNVINAVSSFDNFKAAVSGVFENIKTLLSPAFVRLQKLVKGTQLAFKQLFQPKDVEGILRLQDELKALDEKFVEVKEQQIELIEGAKEYTKSTFESAKANVELNRTAEKATVINQGLIEQFDILAEQQRQIRDEERNTIEERIAANNRLREVLEEQASTMKANAEQVLAAAQAQFDKNQSDENFIRLQEAKNELLAVEAQVTGFLSEQKVNDLALERERQELAQSNIDAEAERNISQQQFLAEQIEGEFLRLEAVQQVALEEARIEEERLTNKRNQFKEGTQAFADANNELLAFQQQNAQDQIKIEKNLAKSKEQLTSQALGNLATIVGKNSKFGKAIAIVQAIRDTFAGANKALSAAPPPFNFISAAAVVAAGIANVKSITSTTEPTPPAGLGSGGGSVGGGAVVPQAPSFNIVGSDPQNQLAQTLAEQTNKPVKAFVVSGDVTTAQGLERNIIQESALG